MKCKNLVIVVLSFFALCSAYSQCLLKESEFDVSEIVSPSIQNHFSQHHESKESIEILSFKKASGKYPIREFRRIMIKDSIIIIYYQSNKKGKIKSKKVDNSCYEKFNSAINELRTGSFVYFCEISNSHTPGQVLSI